VKRSSDDTSWLHPIHNEHKSTTRQTVAPFRQLNDFSLLIGILPPRLDYTGSNSDEGKNIPQCIHYGLKYQRKPGVQVLYLQNTVVLHFFSAVFRFFLAVSPLGRMMFQLTVTTTISFHECGVNQYTGEELR
jgi:hypothetical protein